MYIAPRVPWENGQIESFHDNLRYECLNQELLCSVAEARLIVQSWRVEYNEQRPHSELGYLTPEEYTNQIDGG
jgi:putative transposase